MEVTVNSAYELEYPSWSSFRRGFVAIVHDRVYSAHIRGLLVGYLAMGNRSYHQAANDTNKVRNFAEVSLLEVHPDHRRRGTATILMEMACRDYIDQNLMLECVWDDSLFSFYTGLGFCALSKNEGMETLIFMKLVDDGENDPPTVLFGLQQANTLEVDAENTMYAGCVWSTAKKRFIRPERSHEEEIRDVKNDGWEIFSVNEQTPELQRLAISNAPCAMQYITSPTPEARLILLEKKWSYADLIEPLTADEEVIFERQRRGGAQERFAQ